VEDDATLWVGTMFPQRGKSAHFGVDNARGADLARRDFVTITQGIPVKGHAPRPLALIDCDDSEDPMRAAMHLVESAGVPAVVGFGGSKEAVDLARSVFIPRGVLTITAPNRSPMIDAIAEVPGHARMVWRTEVAVTEFAGPIAAVVEKHLEPLLRSRAQGPIGVALLRSEVNVGQSLADVLYRTLRFNGRSALENGESFKQFIVDDEAAHNARIVQDLVRFHPDLILYLAEPEVAVFERIERAWSGAQKPYYVFPAFFFAEELAFISQDDALRRRVLGIWRPTTVPSAELAVRYREAYPTATMEPLPPAESYDAIYLLAYAATDLGPGALSGEGLARAIARLAPPGPPIDVGPTHILDAFRILGEGRNIDLNGGATSLDFDPTTGEPKSDFTILCVSSGKMGRPGTNLESGLRYNATTKALEGTFVCR
jgi:ABC-type branched-subunit amino acid transport system substrate-binding protein